MSKHTVTPVYGSEQRATISKHGQRGIVQLVRISSRRQQEHWGSHRFQMDQQRHLEVHERQLHMYGIDPERVTTIDVCESAAGDKERPGLNRILELMRERQVGVVLIAMASRLARNEGEGVQILDTASENRVVFLVGGQIFDPRNPHDRAALMRRIVDARLENMERAIWVTQTRDVLARNNEFPIHLPTGLIWADPEDPVYREMAAQEGLAHHLLPEALEKHKAAIPGRKNTLYVLPNPYPGVYRALRLICRWIVSHQDQAEVIRRVNTDSSYPRPGLFPVCHGYRFPLKDPKWVPATTRRIRRWLESPAVFGTYTHISRALQKYVDVDEPEHRDPGAFPGFFDPEQEPAVRAVFSDSVWKEHFAPSYHGPRNYALAPLVCGSSVHGERTCGRRLHAVYFENGSYRYIGSACHGKGHVRSFNASIEETVLAIVGEAFRPTAVEAAVSGLRLSADTTLKRRTWLRGKCEELEQSMGYADRQQTAAGRAEEHDQVERWNRAWKEYKQELDGHRTELDGLEIAVQETGQLTKEDFEQIRELATDITRLLREAELAEQAASAKDKVPVQAIGLRREIVSRLVDRVTVRGIVRGITELTVTFPTGAQVRRLHVTDRPLCSQAERVWAFHAMRRGADPHKLAVEMNDIRGRVTSGRMKGVAAWSSDRVQAAALLYEHSEEVNPREGRHESVATLAKRVGVQETDVLRAAFTGTLGPAQYAQGGLRLRPTRCELHTVFPEYARKDVARQQRWGEENTAPLHQFSQEIRRTPPWVETRARRGAGIAVDEVGRRYVRRSDILDPVDPLTLALEDSDDFTRALDRQWWKKASEIRSEYPWVKVRLLTDKVPTVRLNKKLTFYHLPPDVAERFRVRSLEEVVVELGFAREEAQFFLPRTEVETFLRNQFGFGSKTPMETAGKQGWILEVEARLGRKGHRTCTYVWVPEEVRSATDPDVAKRWLRGELSSIRQ